MNNKMKKRHIFRWDKMFGFQYDLIQIFIVRGFYGSIFFNKKHAFFDVPKLTF